MKFLKCHKNKTYRKEKFKKEQLVNRRNCQGDDFSNKDIRGVDFSADRENKYDFTNANFKNVDAGICPRWEKFLKSATFVLSFFAGLTIGYSGAMIAYIAYIDTFFFISLIVNGVILVFFSCITLVRGWGKTLTTLAEIVTVSLFLATFLIAVIACTKEDTTGNIITVRAVFSFLSSIGIIAGVFNIAICLNFAHILSIRNPTRFIIFIITMITLVGAFFGIIFGVRGEYAKISYTLASIIAFFFIWLGIHVGLQAENSKTDQKYWLIRWLTTTIARVRATKFNGATLKGANFTGATLGYTDFTNADLTNICWDNVQGREFALLNTTYCHKFLHLYPKLELSPSNTINFTIAEQAIDELSKEFRFQVESEERNQSEIKIHIIIPENINLKNVIEKFQDIYDKLKPKIYISYNWQEDSNEMANQLVEAFEAKGIEIIRNKTHTTDKDPIKNFMQQIGQGKCVVAVISDRYLKSENCMFELVEIARNGDFYDRIFPIVLPDARIYKANERLDYIQYWEKRIQELETAMKSGGLANLQGDLNLYTEICHRIASLTDILKDMNTFTPDLHRESEFAAMIQAVETKLAEDGQNISNPTGKTSSSSSTQSQVKSESEYNIIYAKNVQIIEQGDGKIQDSSS